MRLQAKINKDSDIHESVREYRLKINMDDSKSYVMGAMINEKIKQIAGLKNPHDTLFYIQVLLGFIEACYYADFIDLESFNDIQLLLVDFIDVKNKELERYLKEEGE